MGFSTDPPIDKSSNKVGEKGCLFLVWTLNPIVNFCSWDPRLRNRSIDSCWCPNLEPPDWWALLLSFQMLFVGWELRELETSDCPKIFAFETAAIARQLGFFLWADCYILVEIIYCNSNRVGTKIESLLVSVVGDWEDHNFMLVDWLNLSGWL